MIIDIQNFSGMRPLIEPELLAMEDASSASAIVPSSGALDPEVQPVQVATVTKAGTPISIYYLASIWLHWTTDVDVVRDPRAGNTNNRVIYTGDGKPKFTDFTLATTGVGTDYPLTWYQLGLPAPAVAASLTVAGGTTPSETRSYVYTFVDAYGSEGPPSAALTTTGNLNGTWNFNGMSTTNPTDCNVTKKRIYRTVTSTSGEVEYLFVAEVTLATANYADTIATTALGEILPSTGWVAPDAGMTNVTALPGGILAGISGNEICFCEPYQPHAWPSSYRISVDFPLVSCGAFNSNLVATTTGNPYIVSGSHPSEMGITKIDATEPCVSKRGTVAFGFGVAYPSPNGLVMVTTQGTDVVTKEIFTRDQWQALIGYSTLLITLSSNTVVAARYQGRYIFFTVDAGQVSSRFGIIDKTNKGCFYKGTLVGGGINVAKGFFVNQQMEDQLYFIDNQKKIWSYGWTTSSLDTEFQPAATSRDYFRGDWTSKRFKLPRPASLGYLRVQADLSNAHPAYLAETESNNLALVGLADKSPISGHAISDVAISEGSARPVFAPGVTLAGAYQQGYVQVTVSAGNSQGRHASAMDALQTIDTVYVRSGAPIPILNVAKFDTWQIAVSATCRVKRIQLAESAIELRNS